MVIVFEISEQMALQCIVVPCQVTSFAELMNRGEVMTLTENLKQAGTSVELHAIFLKDFVKENKFTEAVK